MTGAEAADADRRLAAMLAGRVDAVLLGDAPWARAQLPPAVRGANVAREGLVPWCGINARDRNRVALESELAGLEVSGIAAVHCVTGDHPSLGHRPDARAVFDLDSTAIVGLAARTTSMLISAAESPAAAPQRDRPARAAAKIAAGAQVLFVNHCAPEHCAEFVAELAALAPHPTLPGQPAVPLIACVPLVISEASADRIAKYLHQAPSAELLAALSAPDPVIAAIDLAVRHAHALLAIPGSPASISPRPPAPARPTSSPPRSPRPAAPSAHDRPPRAAPPSRRGQGPCMTSKPCAASALHVIHEAPACMTSKACAATALNVIHEAPGRSEDVPMPELIPSEGPIDLVVTGVDVLVRAGDVRRGIDLVVHAGRIAALSPAPSSARERATETIDGTHLLAMPGLVNAHTHSAENPMRGLGDGLPLEPWLATLMAEGGLYDAEDHYWCSLASAAELLLSGGTGVIDHLVMTPISADSFDGAMRAYRDSGIRGGVAPLLSDHDATVGLAADLGVDVTGLVAMMPEQAPAMPTGDYLQLTEDAIGRWHGAEGGRLHLLAGASGVQWASDELLGGMAQLAERTGTTMQLHCVETRLQAASCHHGWGRSAVQRLGELGVLNPRTSLAHCVWIEDHDIGAIADAGAVVAHNPAANQRLRSGRAPIAALLAAGARVGIGTDGAASGDDQNSWIAMRLAALIHRDPDEPWVSATEAIAMATELGGHALGVAGLGALDPGAPADFALLDRRAPGLAGARELEAALVWSESGSGVRHTVVAGEIVVRDGQLTTVDLDEIQAHIAEQCERRARRGPQTPALVATIARLQEVRRRLAERQERAHVEP